MAMHKKKYNNRTRKSKRSRKIKIDPIKVVKQNGEFRYEMAAMIFFLSIGILSLIEGIINHQNLIYGICLMAFSILGLVMTTIAIRSYRKDQTIERGYHKFRAVTRILLYVMAIGITGINAYTIKFEGGSSLWYVIGSAIAIGLYGISMIWILIVNKLKLKAVQTA